MDGCRGSGLGTDPGFYGGPSPLTMDPRRCRTRRRSGLTPLVQQRLPGDIALKIGGNHRRVFGDTLPGGSGDMRRDNHVIELDDKG